MSEYDLPGLLILKKKRKKKQEASFRVKCAYRYLHRKSFEVIFIFILFFTASIYYMPHYLADVINNASHMFAIILSNRQSRIMYEYIQ